jgi:chaperone BCS1
MLPVVSGSTWSRALARPKRSFDSVILDSNVSEEIFQDAKEFLARADWYRKLGVPYRRSYLLHGKPGCGKTSFVTGTQPTSPILFGHDLLRSSGFTCAALAGKLNLNVCVVSLNGVGLTDGTLTQAFRDAPESSLLLIEDIDAAFPSREEHHAMVRSDICIAMLSEPFSDGQRFVVYSKGRLPR